MPDCSSCDPANPSRRRFVTQILLTAAAAWVAEGCGDGVIGGPAGPDAAPPIGGGGTLSVRIADFPALSDVGGIARVDDGSRTPVAVVRLGPNTFVALSLVCPHAGYRPVSIQSSGFECPNHGARFDTDGTWIGGQRTKDMLQYPVAYDPGAGTLTIG